MEADFENHSTINFKARLYEITFSAMEEVLCGMKNPKLYCNIEY